MTTPTKTDLLPCPFCGSKPVKGMTPKRGCQMHGDPMQYVTISCKNERCPSRPSVSGNVCRYGGGDDPKYHAEATQDAIKVWNTRTPTVNLAELRERVEKLRKPDGDRLKAGVYCPLSFNKAIDAVIALIDGAKT